MVVALPQNRQIANAGTLQDCKNEINGFLSWNQSLTPMLKNLGAKINRLSDEKELKKELIQPSFW